MNALQILITILTYDLSQTWAAAVTICGWADVAFPWDLKGKTRMERQQIFILIQPLCLTADN